MYAVFKEKHCIPLHRERKVTGNISKILVTTISSFNPFLAQMISSGVFYSYHAIIFIIVVDKLNILSTFSGKTEQSPACIYMQLGIIVQDNLLIDL